MHNEIQVFTNEMFGSVRTTVIDGKPWFVGRDVAEALGYESPRSAVSKKVDAEDRGVAEMETPSGRQQMTIINESGLYSLILSSKTRLCFCYPKTDKPSLLLRYYTLESPEVEIAARHHSELMIFRI